MRFTILIFFFLTRHFCFGQNADVVVKNIYIDSTETNSFISSIHCEINSIPVDSTKKIRLLFAEGKEKSGKKYKIDDFDYFGYDDMVLKNTFPIIFFTNKKIENPLQIQGKIRYFTPSLENGGLKIIENPKQKNNINIYNGEEDIKVIVIDIDKFVETEKDGKQFKTLIDKVVSKNNLNKKQFKRCIKLLMSDHKTYNWSSKQYFAFYVEDKNDKLAGLHTLINDKIAHDGGGTYRFGSSSLVTRRFRQSIESNWKIVLEIETDKSINDLTFVLSDISLFGKQE
ncbi:hypothetical protein [Flavobacterium caeni]|uniref:Uncharacterized protein n=1 Tax=Flavobacterium caeni TaxID=490189 RepID=A0A1G5KJ68_9FLAO|nr:hypothetical protein [Flavobacterium caeni]SCZ00291.1 hypothetical protein SAMN02927903_03323 [Flavobacterium caeni]